MNGIIFYIRTFIQFYFILSVMGDGSSSSSSTSKGPGPAVCKCFGGVDKDCFPNGPIDIADFPEECSSYVYDGMAIWPNGSITDPTWTVVNRTEGYFEMLLASGKDVYLYIMHVDQSHWACAVRCVAQEGEASPELETWKTTMESYPNLKGVIFQLLDEDDSSEEDPEYSQNLKVYIELLKCVFPSYTIGVHLNSTTLISDLDSGKTSLLDLTAIDCVVDFYVISQEGVGDCTSEYKCVGIYPVGPDSDVGRVTKHLNELNIPKEKYIYEYLGSAVSPVDDEDCNTLYPLICVNPPDVSADFCADTTCTFYEKGQYAAANAGGFMFINIDEDDTLGCCQCGRTYPAFRDILDGFNGSPVPEPCCLFDRT